MRGACILKRGMFGSNSLCLTGMVLSTVWLAGCPLQGCRPMDAANLFAPGAFATWAFCTLQAKAYHVTVAFGNSVYILRRKWGFQNCPNDPMAQCT